LTLYNGTCTYHYGIRDQFYPHLSLLCSLCARDWEGRRVFYIFSTSHLLPGRKRGSGDSQRHLHLNTLHAPKRPSLTAPWLRQTEHGKSPQPTGASRPRTSRSITSPTATKNQTNPSPRSNTTPQRKPPPKTPERSARSPTCPCRRRSIDRSTSRALVRAGSVTAPGRPGRRGTGSPSGRRGRRGTARRWRRARRRRWGARPRRS